jgi:Curli production assembly/transport component CsgG
MPPPVHKNTAGLPFLFSAANLCLLLILSGCSMVMATHGHPEPNFDRIKIGATREVIEHEFGTPIASHRLEGGTREDTYRYEMGNSSNPGRATVYLYAYLTIVGILGEPIYSLIELLQGSDEETTVKYGPDNNALMISGYEPPPPSAALQAGEQAQAEYRAPGGRSGTFQNEPVSTEPPEAVSSVVDAKLKELAHRLSASIKEHGIVRIAILPVRDISEKDGQTLGTYLTEKLTAKLHEEKVAKIVERSRLTTVTNELALTYSGNFDEGTFMKIGKLLGAEAVVTTSYADLGRSSIEVNSTILSVETGEILGVGTAVLPRSALERMLR